MPVKYKRYTVDEIIAFINEKESILVPMVLDQPVVDYLLSINTCNKELSNKVVREIMQSIIAEGWQSGLNYPFIVFPNGILGNGQHRLTAIKRLGYPRGIFSGVLFGSFGEAPRRVL